MVNAGLKAVYFNTKNIFEDLTGLQFDTWSRILF